MVDALLTAKKIFDWKTNESLLKLVERTDLKIDFQPFIPNG